MKKTGILIVCFFLMFFIGKVIVMRKKDRIFCVIPPICFYDQ